MAAKFPSSSSPGILNVQLSPPFLRRICAYLRAPEPAGIQPAARREGALFGTAHERFVRVQAFRSLPGQGFREVKSQDPPNFDVAVETLLEVAKTDRELKALQLVGWYSIRALNLHGLTAREIELYNKRLQPPAPIGLVLSPEHPAKVLAELYTRSSADGFSEECHYRRALLLNFDTEVEMDEPMNLIVEPDNGDYQYDRVYQVLDSLGHGTDATRRRRVADPIPKQSWSQPGTAGLDEQALSGEPGGDGCVSDPITPAKSSESLQTRSRAGLDGGIQSVIWPHSAFLKKRRPVAAVALLGIAGLALAWVVHNRSGAPQPVATPSAAVTPATRRPATVIMPPSPGLGMEVKIQGDGLFVSWDRRSPAVQRAQSGVLVIDDGDQHRRVNLTPTQIANGSILYRPGSGDVIIALELLTPGGPVNSEHVRILDGRNPDSSAPPKSTLTMLGGNSPGGVRSVSSSHPPARKRKQSHVRAKAKPDSEESAAFSAPPSSVPLAGDLRLAPSVQPQLRLPLSTEARNQDSTDTGERSGVHPPTASGPGARVDDGNVVGRKWRSLKRKVLGGLKYSKEKLTKDGK
jgi:hypothetical protein